jgi:hypothetical protein
MKGIPMIKTTLALLGLLCLMASVAMAEGPTLVMNPSSVTLPEAATQYITVSFSDGSHLRGCVWSATGDPPNSILAAGTNATSAVFGAGTNPGQYVVTAICSNAEGVTAVGSMPVTIPQQ